MDFLIDKKIQAAILPFLDRITFLENQVKTLTDQLETLRKEQTESISQTKEHLKIINEEVSTLKTANQKMIPHPVDKAGAHKKETNGPKNVKKTEVHNVPSNHAPKEVKKQMTSPIKTVKGVKKTDGQPTQIEIKPVAQLHKNSEETSQQIVVQTIKKSQINDQKAGESNFNKGNEPLKSPQQMNHTQNINQMENNLKVEQQHTNKGVQRKQTILIDHQAEQRQDVVDSASQRLEITTIQKLKTQTEELEVNLMEEDEVMLLEEYQQFQLYEQPNKSEVKIQFVSQNNAGKEQQLQNKQQIPQIKIQNLSLNHAQPQKIEKLTNVKQKKASPKLTERQKAKKQTPVIEKTSTGSGTKKQTGRTMKTLESQPKNTKSVLPNKQKADINKGVKQTNKAVKQTNHKVKQVPKSVQNSIKKEVHQKNGITSSQKKSNQTEKTKKVVHLNQQCQQKSNILSKQSKADNVLGDTSDELLKIRIAEKLSQNVQILYNKMSEMVKMLPEDLDQMSYKQIKIYHQLGINISKSVNTNQLLISIGQMNKMISQGEEMLHSRSMVSKVINMINILMNIVHGTVALQENQSKQTEQQRVNKDLRSSFKKAQNLMKQIEPQAIQMLLSDISMMKLSESGLKTEDHSKIINNSEVDKQLPNNEQIMLKNGLVGV